MENAGGCVHEDTAAKPRTNSGCRVSHHHGFRWLCDLRSDDNLSVRRFQSHSTVFFFSPQQRHRCQSVARLKFQETPVSAVYGRRTSGGATDASGQACRLHRTAAREVSRRGDDSRARLPHRRTDFDFFLPGGWNRRRRPCLKGRSVEVRCPTRRGSTESSSRRT